MAACEHCGAKDKALWQIHCGWSHRVQYGPCQEDARREGQEGFEPTHDWSNIIVIGATCIAVGIAVGIAVLGYFVLP